MPPTATPIEKTPDYVQHREGRIPCQLQLVRRGYILRQLTPTQLEHKERCARCPRQLHTKARRRSTWDQHEPGGKKCKFHPGKVAYGKWTCCGRDPRGGACREEYEHLPRTYAEGEREANWRFFTTPQYRHAGGEKPAAAVAIDCEMGAADNGDPELIRVSAVDYFSGAVLVDSLVWPDVEMRHYNTRFSGVTRKQMEDARRRRKCIFGRARAREEIWKHVGPETIIIGHAAHNDLIPLRWIHPRVIDTLLVEEAVSRRWEQLLLECREEQDE